MKEKQNSICLRPHHGMCLAYFEGRGYSREFAEHMGKFWILWKEMPGYL